MTEHIINDIEQAMQGSLNNEQMLLLHQVLEYTMRNVDVTEKTVERVCLQHIDQIKAALGFSAVISNVFSWTYKPKNPMERGTQIDLLIDRNDQTINLCEMKYTKTPYFIDKEEDERLHNRLGIFQREQNQ